MFGRGDAVGQRVKLRLGAWERLLHREEAGDDAFDVAVDYDCPAPEGDRGDCSRGVAADAGKLQELGFRAWEAPVMISGHLPGTGDEISGAGIIAEAGPGAHHVRLDRRGERFDRRPSARELLEIGPDGGDRGLLKHHLG
jgi:hypothetical protein